MAVSLTHATEATGTDSADGRVSKNAWNEEHELTAAESKLLGTVAASTTVGEITLGTSLALTDSTLDVVTDAIQDIAGAMATAGANVTVAYDDGAGTLTIAAPTEGIQDIVGAMAAAGANTTVAYDDGAGTLTIAAPTEGIQDIVGAMVVAGSNVTATYDDGANTLTIAAIPGGYDTVAELEAATIPADVKSTRTGGYTAAGDGGNGLYARMAAAPADPTNPGYLRSVDRYTSAGATDATHGGYWELVLEGDEFRIEQFGGAGEYVNSGDRGTDNYQPILDYIDFSPTHATSTTFMLRPALRFSARKYWVSSLLDISTQVHLRGPAQGMDVVGGQVNCHLIFPTGTGCFIFQGHSTGPGHTGTSGSDDGAGGSSLDGLLIKQEGIGVQGAAEDAHGVHMRTVVHIRNCVLDLIAGDGIHINAGAGTGGGNANRWLVKDSEVKTAWGHGLFVEGADANAGNCINLYTKECGKCGICELSGLGNYYSHCEIDGYGNGGVNDAGENYIQITTAPTVAVAPGSNETHWYHIGSGSPSATFPAWNSGTTYTVDDLKLPIFSEGASNTSEFYGVYSEFGTAPSHMGTSQWFLGGNLASTLKTQQIGSGTRGLQSTRGFSGHRNFSSHNPGYTTHGAYISAQLGTMTSTGGTDFDTDMDLLLFERETDERTYLRYNSANNIQCLWATGSSVPIWGWTGTATTSTPGPRNFFSKDLSLMNPADTTEFRRIGMRNALPTAAGYYGAGDYFRGNGATSWRCSTAGGIKDLDWSATNIGNGEVVKTGAGRYYRNKFFIASTVEPTHLSGVETTADGAVWTYLASTDAAFTLVQDVVKQTNAYTPTNVVTDRSFNANATTTDELADVLGTLIADLQSAGVIS
jgi:hypothetical protein